MKQVLVFTLTLSILFSLISCQSAQVNTEEVLDDTDDHYRNALREIRNSFDDDNAEFDPSSINYNMDLFQDYLPSDFTQLSENLNQVKNRRNAARDHPKQFKRDMLKRLEEALEKEFEEEVMKSLPHISEKMIEEIREKAPEKLKELSIALSSNEKLEDKVNQLIKTIGGI